MTQSKRKQSIQEREAQREEFVQNVLKLDKISVLKLEAYGLMLRIMDIARTIDRIENFAKKKATAEKAAATRERNKQNKPLSGAQPAGTEDCL